MITGTRKISVINQRSGLLIFLLLQGCSDEYMSKKPDPDSSGYFTDATECYQQSMQTQKIKVPTGLAMTVVEVPMNSAAGKFSACMQYAGHRSLTVDTETYMKVSRDCMLEARDSVNSNDIYVDCVRNGGIDVEVISE